MNGQDELVLLADLSNLEQVSSFVEKHLAEKQCPAKVQMQIEVAVEEIFVNIAQYAYAPKTGSVTIQVRSADDSVSITFIDHGTPYNPLLKKDPDITLSSEKRPIGGLGIYMVKKTMDEVHYEYADGRNILTLYKAWPMQQKS